MTTITSVANRAVKDARKLRRRQARRRSQTFVVEGPALREARAHLRELFVAADQLETQDALVDQARADGATVHQVSPDVLASLADTVTPHGVVGVAELPAPALDDVIPTAELIVVLCGVADPGNLGAIVRSGDAAGVDAIVLTSGSVDVRNPKAVRASAGSIFHLPICEGVGFEQVLRACRRRGLRLVAADTRGAQTFETVSLDRPTALVFGGEAHGLPADVLTRCDAVARVPMFAGYRAGYTGAAESLNLAATVALVAFEAARQRERRTDAAGIA